MTRAKNEMIANEAKRLIDASVIDGFDPIAFASQLPVTPPRTAAGLSIAAPNGAYIGGDEFVFETGGMAFVLYPSYSAHETGGDRQPQAVTGGGETPEDPIKRTARDLNALSDADLAQLINVYPGYIAIVPRQRQSAAVCFAAVQGCVAAAQYLDDNLQCELEELICDMNPSAIRLLNNPSPDTQCNAVRDDPAAVTYIHHVCPEAAEIALIGKRASPDDVPGPLAESTAAKVVAGLLRELGAARGALLPPAPENALGAGLGAPAEAIGPNEPIARTIDR